MSDPYPDAPDKPELTAMMARAREVFELYVAMQEAGFEKGEALALMNSMIITSRTR